METREQLFRLIKSLSKNEKRYFKVFAQKNDNDETKTQFNYVMLFDAIDGQKSFDDDKLKVMVKSKLKITHLPVLKNQLFELILKSLTEYHRKKSIDFKINDMIGFVKLLQQKGLFKQAVKYLTKAFDIATQHEKMTRMLEILEIEKEMIVDMRMGDIKHGLDKIMDQEKLIVEKLSNKSMFMSLFFESQKVLKNEKYIRSDDKMGVLKKLLQNDLMKDSSSAKTLYSLNSFYELHSIYLWIINETEDAYKTKRKQVSIWEQNEWMINEYKKNYIILIPDFLYIAYHAGKLKELPIYINILKNVETYDVELKQKIFTETSVFSLIYYQQIIDYTTCLELLKNIKTELPLYEKSLNIEDSCRIFISSSLIAYGGEDYKQAVFWINKIINMREVEMREDAHCFARIFNLIIHLKLDDGFYLQYAINSTYRFLNKREKLFTVEKAILKFMKNYITLDDDKKINSAYIKFKKDLLKIQEDPFEKKFFKIFDFITWVESKIENIHYKDLLKLKKQKAAQAD